MIQYVIRRLLLLIPVLIGILLVTFIITRAVPSDPCFVMLGEKATVEQCERFRLAQAFTASVPPFHLVMSLRDGKGLVP